MPSHLSCRCAQHYFPWPVQFQFLERDSPDLICFHMHFLLSSCTAALAVIRWLSWLWHSCLHLCPSLSAPLEYTSWSSTCKPPSFIPHLSDYMSALAQHQHFLYPGTAGNIFLWFSSLFPPDLLMATTAMINLIFAFSGHSSSSSSAQRRPLPHSGSPYPSSLWLSTTGRRITWS